MEAKEIKIRYFVVDPKEIVFIKAILESYEGMVVVRTVEIGKPVIELLIAHDFSDIADQVIRELQSQVQMGEIDSPEDFDSTPSPP